MKSDTYSMIFYEEKSYFHCSKGRQRNHVFVLGYDETFFDYYSGRGKDKNDCLNDLLAKKT